MIAEWGPILYLITIMMLVWWIWSLPLCPTGIWRRKGRIKLRKKSAQHYRRFHYRYPLKLRSIGQYLYRRDWNIMYLSNEAYMGVHMPPHQLKCKIAMHDEAAFTAGMSEEDLFTIIWDSGASTSVSPDLRDFAGGLVNLAQPTMLQGLASGLHVKGRGIVHWNVVDAQGTIRTIQTRALYVPNCSQRLLSPQAYLQDLQRLHPDREYHSTLNSQGFQLLENEQPLYTVELDGRTNLPTSLAYRSKGIMQSIDYLNLCVTDSKNQNITESQKELLRWHFRLGHIRFESVQMLLRSGVLAVSEAMKALHRAAAKAELPRCASCQFGKAKVKPSPGKPRPTEPDNSGALRKDKLLPGQQVSVDHFVGGPKGRLYTSKGKTDSGKMYAGGAIFVDHASSFIHVEHQIALTSHETLQSKHKFEAMCRDVGVTIQTYHTDNGSAFNNREFAEELKQFRQIHTFAGVGAHHQNGVAERAIQTIMSMSRTMMLHAAIKWPDTCDLSLWPMAVDYAVYIYNHVPNPKTGLSPTDVFTQTRWPLAKCHDLHVWGSPIYVLDPTIQDGKKLPRWNPRSRRGKFLGLSRNHASSVPLVLNLDSGYISPQYHCVFDDWFTTVVGEGQQEPDLDSPKWQELFAGSRYQYPFDDTSPSLGPEWSEDYLEVSRARERQEEIRALQDDHFEDQTMDHDAVATTPSRAPQPQNQPSAPRQGNEGADIQVSPPVDTPASVPILREPNSGAANPPQTVGRRISFGHLPGSPGKPPTPLRETVNIRLTEPLPPLMDHTVDGVRRSSRTNKGTLPSHLKNFVVNWASADTRMTPSTPTMNEIALEAWIKTEPGPELSALLANSSDPDTLRYDEAMEAPDSAGFREAMQKEISSLVDQGTWTPTTKEEAHKAGKAILPGTWTFKRKRTPEGEVKKLKARYCVRGDLQGPVTNTFAPVVMWSTIRLLLFFVLTLGLKTRCIDFSNAFVQAKLDDPIYIHLPRGFHSTDGPNTCLRLEKSLYGIAQAPRLWFDHLKAKLESNGFTQSTLDPCLFYSKEIILVCYVDDIIMAAKDKEKLDTLVNNLAETSDLTDEGELESFLGIKVNRSDDGKMFTLTQPMLTERIIEAMGMTEANPRATPAQKEALKKDEDGPAMTENWNYPSIVGMLMFLANNTRPDIAFAVNQCARFTHSPKQSHAVAVKAIVRYLIGTRNKGLILKPTNDLAVDCYVDADFAGLFGVEDDQDPSCAKSRSGYVINVGGCPLTWASKLQTEIALSTCEAEYVALAAALREVIYLRQVVAEMGSHFGMDDQLAVRTHSAVFEDNNGALSLAATPKLTPRSRHYATKYHFFRSHVASGTIQLKRIDTKDQLADIFTKGTTVEIFQRLRQKLCGW
jgi:Reverse transcriptase (RNA-dependent DNA polymerase)